MARIATVVGKGGRPSIIIDKGYRIWLGNETTSKLSLCATELFGFNAGHYEEKLHLSLHLVSVMFCFRIGATVVDADL